MTRRFSFFIKEVLDNRSVLWILVWKQLILRYRRTALGYLWTLINPLLSMTVMAVVFSTLFKSDIKTFALFLFAGMIPWNCFNSIVTQSASAYTGNEALIKKIYLPKVVFPLSISCALIIDSILSFFALFIIILVIGGSISWAILFIPVAYLFLFIFSFGAGLIISTITVFFRDLQHVMTVAMQGLFFLTPVLYKPETFSGKLAWLIDLNPVAPFIELFRAPLYQATIPAYDVIFKAAMISLAFLTFGLIVFLAQEKKIVFRL